MRILLIEDEPHLAALIQKGLEEQQSYQVISIHDGRQGLDRLLQEDFDLLILDVMLPGLNGFEVCRAARNANKRLPILMLTALGATENKVQGLDSGADDYLVKPFQLQELHARVRALSRRHDMSVHLTYKVADLEMDTYAKVVRRAGKSVKLTAREYLLLELFLKNKGIILSRAQIAEQVWEINFDTGTNVIDVYVNYLRNKIDKNHEPKLIHTVVGMGYVLREE